MLKKLSVLCLAIISLVILSTVAQAEGEAILALTGQYTFFIKPEPGSCDTYCRKLVPCVLERTIPVPRRVAPVYPVPVSAKRRVPALRSEIPVGCADGSGPCLQCFPKPSCRPVTRNMVVPVPKPVRVPGIRLEPKCVKERVMRPQWFKVTEEPRPLKRPRKVRYGG